MKIMFAGDIHGNTDHMEWLANKAFYNDIEVIISCGDFGFWPHKEWGQHFLDRTDYLLSQAGAELFWVDGNHENHDFLDDLRSSYGDSEPIWTSDRTRWVPRGCVFDLGELSLMGYGGAWSVDWEERTEGKTWWPQETIDEGHVNQIAEQKVDILVSHEAPLSAEDGILSYKDVYSESLEQRRLITEVARRVKPDLVMCGHHHLRETFLADTPHHSVVNVLGRDEMDDESVFVLEATKAAVLGASSMVGID